MEVDDLLHYGLLIGAVFQLIAIGAIIFLPSAGKEDEVPDGKRSTETTEGVPKVEGRSAETPTSGQGSTVQPQSAARKRKGKNKR